MTTTTIISTDGGNNLNTFLSPLPTEEKLRMTSLTIAELCGKRHDHILTDIDLLINDMHSTGNPGEWDNLAIESKIRKSKRGEVRYFELNEDAALNIVSGYSRSLRNKIIREWRFYRAAFHNRQWRSDDVEVQKRVMQTLHDTLDNAVKLDYIKANTITNKAVSNLYGFEKMLKKDDMSRPMLDDRQRILEDFEKLFSVSQDYGWIKDAIYAKYKQKQLEK